VAYSERPGLGYTAFVVHWTRWEKTSYSYCVTSSPKWKPINSTYRPSSFSWPWEIDKNTRFWGKVMVERVCSCLSQDLYLTRLSNTVLVSSAHLFRRYQMQDIMASLCLLPQTCIWRARLVSKCVLIAIPKTELSPLPSSGPFYSSKWTFKMEPHNPSQVLPQVVDDSWTWTRQVVLYSSSFPGWSWWVAQYHFQGSSQSC
jgi:hypothetical protein